MAAGVWKCVGCEAVKDVTRCGVDKGGPFYNRPNNNPYCKECELLVKRYCNYCKETFSYKGPVSEYIKHVQDCEGEFNKSFQRIVKVNDAEDDTGGIPDTIQVTRSSRNPVKQDKFKKELLKKFQSKCIITGTGVVKVLEAAHILPWAITGFHVAVGLLLRSDIHKLWDEYLISIKVTPKGCIVIVNESLKGSEYYKFHNRVLHVKFSDKTIRLLQEHGRQEPTSK